MKRVTVVLALFLTVAVYGQDKPKSQAPSIPPNGGISEVSRLRLSTTYQRYVIASLALQRAQQQMPEAAQAYNAAVAQAITDEKLAKGTTFNVNIETGEVTAIAPQVPAPPTDKK